MSTELPLTTRHRRDMTEKLLKATLNPNTHTHTTRNQVASVFPSSYVVAHTLPSREIECMYIRLSLSLSSKSRQGLGEGDSNGTAPQPSFHCARFLEDFPPNLPIHFSTAFLMNLASGLSYFVGLMILR